jgi:hypothetical protein
MPVYILEPGVLAGYVLHFESGNCGVCVTGMAKRMTVSTYLPGHRPALLIIAIMLSIVPGCASVPCSYGQLADYNPPPDSGSTLSLEEGRPNRIIDGNSRSIQSIRNYRGWLQHERRDRQ